MLDAMTKEKTFKFRMEDDVWRKLTALKFVRSRSSADVIRQLVDDAYNALDAKDREAADFLIATQNDPMKALDHHSKEVLRAVEIGKAKGMKSPVGILIVTDEKDPIAKRHVLAAGGEITLTMYASTTAVLFAVAPHEEWRNVMRTYYASDVERPRGSLVIVTLLRDASVKVIQRERTELERRSKG